MHDPLGGSGSPAERFTYEPTQKGDDRDDYQRDRDIILYTSAFKRLSGITQVVSSHTGHVFHNRLTHSLQVAQVGRSVAEKLLKLQRELANAIPLQPHAVEAACLAHDLGHPPFGHVAEDKLNDQVGEEAEGFEGNAQSFRIVTELAFRSGEFRGLNLTRATLRGILKYPWAFPKRPVGAGGQRKKKWGAYAADAKPFEFATGGADGGPAEKSVEAELMDWSDDLTYAIHDVEDFYRAGLIPLHLMNQPDETQGSGKERLRFLKYVYSHRDEIPELKNVTEADLGKILVNVLLPVFTLEGPYEGTRDDRARLRIFTSRMVHRYINAPQLFDAGNKQVKVKVEDEYRKEIALLKQLTWFYVIEAPTLALQQHAQKKMIEYLFGVFKQEVGRSPSHLLPPYYQERLREIPIEEPDRHRASKRLVADLIAGMTEAQVVAVYQRLNGIVVGSAFEKILV
jgi:dGTPase